MSVFVQDERGRVRDIEEVLRERRTVLADRWGKPRCPIVFGERHYRCSLTFGHLGLCLAVFDDQPAPPRKLRSLPIAPASLRANESPGGRSHHLEHPGAWMGAAVRLALPDGISVEEWAEGI